MSLSGLFWWELLNIDWDRGKTSTRLPRALIKAAEEMKASQEVAEGHGPDILQSLLGYALFSAPKEKKNLQ